MNAPLVVTRSIGAAVEVLLLLPPSVPTMAAWAALSNLRAGSTDTTPLVAAAEAIDTFTIEQHMGVEVAELTHALHFATHALVGALS